MKLPVVHDPRPMYVLFSWATADGAFRFALVRDPELGGRRNAFLDAFDRGRKPSIDMHALEIALSKLPRPSVLIWWVDPSRHMTLPLGRDVQRIKGLLARYNITLDIDDTLYEDTGVAPGHKL